MKKGLLIAIIVAVAIVALIIIGAVYQSMYLPKYKWDSSYMANSKEPYGTIILHTILEKTYTKKNFKDVTLRHSQKINENTTNSLIFFIGERAYHDSLDVEWLSNYVSKGNTIFIGVEELPYALLKKITNIESDELNFDHIEDSLISTSFLDEDSQSYHFHRQVLKKKAIFPWKYFNPESLENEFSSDIRSLSTIDTNKTNFIEIRYKKGKVLICSTPSFITNYYLSKENGYQYFKKMYSYIGEVDTVYWDSYSSIYHSDETNSSHSDVTENLLEFILSKKSLRWTWYLFLFALFAFAAFKLKRRQKPIDIVVKDKNTSIEYAKAVGLLHYKTSTYQAIADQLLMLFIAFIKDRYSINLKQKKDENINKVALLSGIDTEIFKDIYSRHMKIIYNPSADPLMIIGLHQKLDYFYKNCK